MHHWGFPIQLGRSLSILQDSADYFYADLWSSKFTWGGDVNNIPVEGDAVIVPEGQTLVIDVVTPVLKLMVVKGELLTHN